MKRGFFCAAVKICNEPPRESPQILGTASRRVTGSSPVLGAKKYTLERVCIFLSKPQAWYIITERSTVYITNNGRAVVVSHHAPACIFLWLDDIQHYVLMICNSFGIDDIHAYRRDFTSCVDALDFGGLFVFLGVKNTLPFTVAPFESLWG